MRYLLSADLHLKPKHKFSDIVEGKIWDEICERKLQVLRKLPKIAEKYEVDKVILAGDIFDNSNPPEALKAEFCKILNSFTKPVVVIPGKPGDHDFVSKNNYVLMDLREAFRGKENITIHNDYYYEVDKGVLVCHVMLEGISDFYKNVVKLSDPIFKGYKTILMGDYHAYYKKTYADRFFVYPSPPYPTRYGEGQGGVVICDTDKTGKTVKVQRVKLKSYDLLEAFDLIRNLVFETPTVVKYKLEVPNDKMSSTLHKLNKIKAEAKKDENVIDVLWSVKSLKDKGEVVDSRNKTLEEVCDEHIKNSCQYPKSAIKIFKKLWSEV